MTSPDEGEGAGVGGWVSLTQYAVSTSEEDSVSLYVFVGANALQDSAAHQNTPKSEVGCVDNTNFNPYSFTSSKLATGKDAGEWCLSTMSCACSLESMIGAKGGMNGVWNDSDVVMREMVGVNEGDEGRGASVWWLIAIRSL